MEKLRNHLQATFQAELEAEWPTPEHKAQREALLNSSAATTLADYLDALEAYAYSMPDEVQSVIDDARTGLEALRSETPRDDAFSSLYIIRKQMADLVSADQDAQVTLLSGNDTLIDQVSKALYELARNDIQMVKNQLPTFDLDECLKADNKRAEMGKLSEHLMEDLCQTHPTQLSREVLNVMREMRGQRHYFDSAAVDITHENVDGVPTVHLTYMDHLGIEPLGSFTNDMTDPCIPTAKRGLPDGHWIEQARRVFYQGDRSLGLAPIVETSEADQCALSKRLIVASSEKTLSPMAGALRQVLASKLDEQDNPLAQDTRPTSELIDGDMPSGRPGPSM